eukprot:scaffold323_cov414-Prasinococcus_capsulatus_cf.AAC.53
MSSPTSMSLCTERPTPCCGDSAAAMSSSILSGSFLAVYWKRILESLEQSMPSVSFQTWRPVQLAKFVLALNVRVCLSAACYSLEDQVSPFDRSIV